jgi:hypothetical protein
MSGGLSLCAVTSQGSFLPIVLKQGPWLCSALLQVHWVPPCLSNYQPAPLKQATQPQHSTHQPSCLQSLKLLCLIHPAKPSFSFLFVSTILDTVALGFWHRRTQSSQNQGLSYPPVSTTYSWMLCWRRPWASQCLPECGTPCCARRMWLGCWPLLAQLRCCRPCYLNHASSYLEFSRASPVSLWDNNLVSGFGIVILCYPHTDWWQERRKLPYSKRKLRNRLNRIRS